MANSSGKTVVEIKLKTIEGTPENFEEFGQVIGLMPDDKDFAPQAAQMVLSQGTPRSFLFLPFLRIWSWSYNFNFLSKFGDVIIIELKAAEIQLVSNLALWSFYLQA